MELRTAVTHLLDNPLDVALARAILGSDDPSAIADRVEALVRAELGAHVVACPLLVQSVGAVFGLDLDDGRRVVVKVHAFGDAWRGLASPVEIAAVYAAQAELAAAGFPCARVLRMPVAFGAGMAAILAWLDAPAGDDPHAPATRRALAGVLAQAAELGGALPAKVRDHLPRSTLPAAVFQPPHNVLFDLAAPGGEWIDARARAARSVLDEPAPAVVMHTDVSCANVRVVGGDVVAVYDMDSVAWIDELRCVASAAVHFTYTGERWTWPTRDEARAFVVDYEAARGRTFTSAERRRLDAGAIYALAYTARCEHGIADSNRAMCELLAAAPDAYFA